MTSPWYGSTAQPIPSGRCNDFNELARNTAARSSCFGANRCGTWRTETCAIRAQIGDAMKPKVGDYVLAHYRGQGILRVCRVEWHHLEIPHQQQSAWALTTEGWGGNSVLRGDDGIKWVWDHKPTRREVFEARTALKAGGA